MRTHFVSRRRSRARNTQPLPFRHTVPPWVELLESRVVPSTLDHNLGVAHHSVLNVSGSASFAAIAGATETGSIFTNATLSTAKDLHGSFGQAAQPTDPTLTSLSPSSGPAGAGGLILTLNGANFAPHSTVHWNGMSLATTFVSSTELMAVVPANLLSQAGTASVTVVSPTGSSSQALTFTIVSTPSNLPVLSGLSVTSVTAGTNGLFLTVVGSNFTSTSVVQWNGMSLTTTFVNGNQLIAFIPANLLAQPGTASVTVLTPGVGSSAALTFTIVALPFAAPTLSSISVTSASAGSNSIILTVSGANFLPQSVVQWNGMSLDTNYVSGNTLFAVIPATLLAQPGTASITVFTPGVGSSAALTFTVTGTPSNVPVLSGLSTTSAPAGTNGLTLTIIGNNFTPNSVVLWNTTPLATTFVSSNQLTAFVPANLLAQAGTASITVSTPGGGTSAAITFTIVAPPFNVPTLSSISVTSAPAGSNSIIVTLSGANFAPTSVVQWNGMSLDTTYVSGNTLFAVIPANLLAQAGKASITVSTPGVGSSGSLTFTVTAPPGGGASAMGPMGPLGQDISTTMNAVEVSPAQVLHASSKPLNPGSASTTPLRVSTASSQAGQATTADSYWQLLSSSGGDQLIDPNGWAVQELTLALEGM